MTKTMGRRPFLLELAAPLVAAGLLACGPIACSRPAEEAPPATGTTFGANAADLAAIARLHQEFAAAHNDADAERLVALFTDDAVLMPMDDPTITGKEGIREHFENFFDQNPSSVELSPVETRVAGDWAYERVQVKVALPGGETQGRHADIKYLWILQKQPDGSWKIARAIYNLDGNIDENEDASARAA